MKLEAHAHRSAVTSCCSVPILTLMALLGCQDNSAPDVATPAPTPVASVDRIAAASPVVDGGPANAMLAAESDPEPAPRTPPAADPQPPPPLRTENVSFDDIAFKMEKGTPFKRSMLTKTIEAYAGRSIRIRGYILPSFTQDGITEFVLVRDNMECCFGPGAALFDCVMVRMVPGRTASFSIRPVTVEGEFGIEEWKDFDGVVRAIYHMKGTSVK